MQIRTMAFGEAMGPACLLLAAGTKGKRFIFPHAIGMNFASLPRYTVCFVAVLYFLASGVT